MKNKIILKSLLIIFLIGNFGFIQGEQVTIFKNTDSKILMENELNIPLNSTEKDMIMNNILFKRLLKENPDLTYGQVAAFTLMINKQMNQSKQFDFKLYIDFLNYSSEYPIKGFNLTARELYDNTIPVREFINQIDEQVVKFTKLSREEMADYLLTETPSASITKNIFENADANEVLYYMNDLDILSNASDDFSDFNLDTVLDVSEKIKKITDDFNYNISVHNLMYKMDLLDGLVNTSLTTNLDKNSSLEKIVTIKNGLSSTIGHIDQMISLFFVLLAFFSAALVALIIIAFTSLALYSATIYIFILAFIIIETVIGIMSASITSFRDLYSSVEKLYDEIKGLNG